MARQVINVSTVPNDRNGDPLRVAFTKVNENFEELYNNSLVSNSITWTPDTGNGWRIVEASGHSIVTLGDPTSEEVWFDPADTIFGVEDFIGASIQYSAYVAGGWNEIGRITFSSGLNDGSYDTDYQRSVIGANGGGGEFYQRSMDNPNVLLFKGDGIETYTAYVQWKGTLFYSADRVE